MQPHTPTRRSPRPIAMALALAISWGSMLAHNLYELPLGFAAVENSGPLLVALALLLAYAFAPSSPMVLALLAAWATLNLVVGAAVTVLPLPVLPFEPEQSVGHYVAHLVYGVGQLPLIWILARAVRGSGSRRGVDR